jgi:AAA domain
MLEICANCGQNRPDKVIDPSGPFAVCPECDYRNPFRQLPLFIVAGASGAGKTTVCRRLTGTLEAVVALDMDVLWRAEFDTPANGYRDFFETWLRLAADIAQSGRPVLLFGAGAGVPGNIEPCIRRRYFSAVHYLALVCDDAALAQRLMGRPAWRGAQAPGFIEGQQQFNQWFKDYAGEQPPMTRVDTTHIDEESAARQVMDWLNDRLTT